MRRLLVFLPLLFVCLGIAQVTDNQVSLSSLGAYRTTFDEVKYNTSSVMKMGNIEYMEGIQFHSDFSGGSDGIHSAYFNLGGSYNRLTGLIGIDDKSTFNSDDRVVTLTFRGDDIEIQKITMAAEDLPVNVDLDVSNVHRLTLEAINGRESGYIVNYIDIDFVDAILWNQTDLIQDVTINVSIEDYDENGVAGYNISV